MTIDHTYRLGISSEFFLPDGSTLYDDIGLARFAELGIEWRALESDDLSEIDVSDLDSMLVLRQRVTADYLRTMPKLRHVARWGAGLDRIDLDACTAHNVAVTTTPQGGRRPVASAALALLLALAHKIPQRDQLVRAGEWASRSKLMGVGIADMTIGIVGLGTIGSEFARLIAPFGARLITVEEHTDSARARALGVEVHPFAEVFDTADAVVLTAPLTPETHGLVSADVLARMKPTAFLVNVARGELVDECALADALYEGRLAGAGLDVFEVEPLPEDSPLMRLDNAILAPHSLAWGEDIIAGNRRQALGDIERVATGQRPDAVANHGVLAQHPWSQLS